jgi:hypothetical protein
MDETHRRRTGRGEMMPKRWFDSDETAAKVLGTTTSAESMVKLLSEELTSRLHASILSAPAAWYPIPSLFESRAIYI